MIILILLLIFAAAFTMLYIMFVTVESTGSILFGLLIAALLLCFTVRLWIM